MSLPWTRRPYGRDSYLVREGEPTTTCSLLLNGFAFRQKLVSDGSRELSWCDNEARDNTAD